MENFVPKLLLIVVLIISLALFSATSSKFDALLPGNNQHVSSLSFNKPLQMKKWRKELLELEDYPITGPNNGHTPAPPPPASGK